MTRVLRRRSPTIRSVCSRRDGTTRFAASVGVDARRSATKSTSGASCSWPIALTTGVRQEATARTRASLLKGSRSSTLPPPRARMITSTSGIASSSASAAVTAATACTPCTGTSRTSKAIAGHRSRALTSTSSIAALARPHTRPIRFGMKGRGFLRSGANSPSAASRSFRRASCASSAPSPTGRISLARMDNEPRAGQKSGFAWTRTRWPSASGGSIRPMTAESATTVSDMSTSVSRSVR